MANVYDVQKVLRSDFLELAGALPEERVAALDVGLRLVLGLCGMALAPFPAVA